MRAPRVCVFDAYGTLFDVHSAAREAREQLGEKWQPLADLWRSKQLQYSWLRSLMGRHADFWQITGEALDFALASLQLRDPPLRERLMALYLRLNTYPDVKQTLARIKAAGTPCAILSNGSAFMLHAAVQSAGIARYLDAVLSVEDAGIYKPHSSVYALVLRRFGVRSAQVCFISSNGWDAHAAKTFGFDAVWCNRFGQPAERLPGRVDAELAALTGLPALLGLA